MNRPARRDSPPMLGAIERNASRTAADWLELAKPRIASYVVLAALTGGVLASGGEVDVVRAFGASLLIGAVAAGAGTFNQILERDVDRIMQRTSDRPLPSGRIGVRDAVLFGAFFSTLGIAGLALAFNVLAALLAASTLLAYLLVYTPLKRASSFNTVAGALSGAMPPLLGAVAVSGAPGRWGWMLFAVVFAWQFPHFLAIAWLYREDYRRAGMKMLPALEGSAGLAGRQAFAYSLLLLPLSILPAVRGDAGLFYASAAIAASVVYAAASAAFAWRESVRTARTVLIASLVYLPMLFLVALVDASRAGPRT